MIIVIVGPTGVGKTKMSVELAKKYNGIVVNADSMSIYKGLDIGTAKVTEEEKQGIPHYLIDIREVDEMYTVYDYQKDLRKVIEDNKDKNIIIVGGTGLYIKAGLYNYEFLEENSYEIDEKSELSNEELYEMVKKIDPNTDIHINNRKRLIRKLNKKGESKKSNELLYSAKFIGLTTSRENLYNRINKRVDMMIENGLIDEVKKYYDLNIKSKAILTGIGYKELYDYFDNKCDLNSAIELIKKRSRNYAKRQYTWFNNQMDINWFDVNFDNFEETINEVVNFIDNN